jgi:hypothetical protein
MMTADESVDLASFATAIISSISGAKTRSEPYMRAEGDLRGDALNMWILVFVVGNVVT